MIRLCDVLLAMPHPKGGRLVDGVCEDCGRVHRVPLGRRYDMTAGGYDQHITVARYNEDAYDGVQMGDLIAVTGGRAGIRWEPTPKQRMEERRWVFSVVPEDQLPELVEDARLQFEEWGRQAAAEQRAEDGWLRAAENAGYDDWRGD